MEIFMNLKNLIIFLIVTILAIGIIVIILSLKTGDFELIFTYMAIFLILLIGCLFLILFSIGF